jgi:hypothetical protein
VENRSKAELVEKLGMLMASPRFSLVRHHDPTRRGFTCAKWAANAPLAMIDQYVPNLKKLHAIAVDAGTQDTGIAATVKTLDQILSQYSIPHAFEIYEGNHINRIAERLETKVLPFFSSNLSFDRAKR